MHLFHWIEIPTQNIDRAARFYSALLNIELNVISAMGMKTAFFPHTDASACGGCLMQGKGYIPSEKGSIPYLNAGNDLQPFLNRVSEAGGKIILPKTAIGQNGFMAHIGDTEGNRIGLYSKE